jgi:hypothetical protein
MPHGYLIRYQKGWKPYGKVDYVNPKPGRWILPPGGFSVSASAFKIVRIFPPSLLPSFGPLIVMRILTQTLTLASLLHKSVIVFNDPPYA